MLPEQKNKQTPGRFAFAVWKSHDKKKKSQIELRDSSEKLEEREKWACKVNRRFTHTETRIYFCSFAYRCTRPHFTRKIYIDIFFLLVQQMQIFVWNGTKEADILYSALWYKFRENGE